jgi:hypothetical protein
MERAKKKENMAETRKIYDCYDMQDSYESGYMDALRWAEEHLYGDNYKLQIRDKINEFLKRE